MPYSIRIFRSNRGCLLLVLPLALLLFTPNLGGRDLWAPDEPRAGEVTREILTTGSWAVLHNNGRPYIEKPPLYFWLGAVLSLPAGRVSELTVRLPANLAALFGVVTVFYLGRNLFGRRTGALAGVVLATAQGYFMEARWAHPDMLFASLLSFACLAFHQAYRTGGSTGWLAGFYLAIGFANLTKGPLGLLLPPLAALVFLAGSRNLAFLRRAGLAWGLALALAPAALWLAAYRVSAGEAYPLGFALERLARRFTEGMHHTRPFLHTFTALPLEFLPWTILLPAALWHTFPRPGSRSDPENAYVYSWIVVLLAVFGISAEKRGVYLLPLLPLLALLVARLWDTALMAWDPPPVDRPIAWSLGAGLILALGAASYYLPRLRREFPDLLPAAILLSGAVILTSIVAVAAHWRSGGGVALAHLAAGLVICYLIIATVVMPALDPFKSARAFSHRVGATVGDAPLGIYPHYHSAYAFYTGRFLATPGSREDLDAFLRSAPRVYCLIEEESYEAVRRTLGTDVRVLDRERVGHRFVLLLVSEGGGGSCAAPQADPVRLETLGS
ncbi:MAG: glycosyltransferase family 39 protein [Acidobacteria bacterium]|nr:glycosyltransferase family 39 protein [Acidobacteriota bacterium]